MPLVVLSASLPPPPAGKFITLTVLVPEEGLVLLVGVITRPEEVTPALELVRA